MAEVSFHVSNMKCGGCVANVTRALQSLAGIKDIDADLESKVVKVQYDAGEVDESRMRTAITNAGYKVE
jgi:copper chaperone CopZ